MAARLQHYVVVIGGVGMDNKPLFHYKIWTYNIYTEQWRTHDIQGLWKAAPAIYGGCIAAIGEDLYMFGGYKVRYEQFLEVLYNGWFATNSVWKLTKTPGEYFISREISFLLKSRRAKSKRCFHTGWDYAGNLWIFGGYTKPQMGI